MIKNIIFGYQEYNFDADQYIYDRCQPAVCIWCGSFDVGWTMLGHKLMYHILVSNTTDLILLVLIFTYSPRLIMIYTAHNSDKSYLPTLIYCILFDFMQFLK